MKEHLELEALSRLVDEAPTPREREHLDRCPSCRRELAALRGQTAALADLPSLRPDPGAWTALEARLRTEGLLGSAPEGALPGAGPPEGALPEASTPGGSAFGGGASGRGSESGSGSGSGSDWASGSGPLQSPSPGRWPGWLQAVAAVLLVALGIGLGRTLPHDATGTTPLALSSELQDSGSLAQAQELVALTEEWHRSALRSYRTLLEEEGVEAYSPGPDALTRAAAIESLMRAGQAAVREVPTDPFLNGLLLNVQVEQEAVRQGLGVERVESRWY